MDFSWDQSRMILTGGRSSDVMVNHAPRTYEIRRVNGSLEFVTYDEQLLKECPAAEALLAQAVNLEDAVDGDVLVRGIIAVIDRARAAGVSSTITAAGVLGTDPPPQLPNESFPAALAYGIANATAQARLEQELAAAVQDCYATQTSLTFNDVWEYNLDCPGRTAEGGCPADSGWTQLDAGARRGGCRIVYDTLLCTHPGERSDHATAVFDDGTLLLFGGRSWICDDYCSDMWRFNTTACRANSTACAWERVGELKRRGPGGRWRPGSTSDGKRLFLFGGHRMWHGFAPENSLSNAWNRTDRYPFGGFLDDLWVYEHLPHRPLDRPSAESVLTALDAQRVAAEELAALVGGTVGFDGAPDEDVTLSFALAEESHRGGADLTLPQLSDPSDAISLASGTVARGPYAPQYNWWGSGVSGGAWWLRGGGHRGLHRHVPLTATLRASLGPDLALATSQGLLGPHPGTIEGANATTSPDAWQQQYSSFVLSNASDGGAIWPWQLPRRAIPRAVAQEDALPPQLWSSDPGFALYAPNDTLHPVGSVVLVLAGFSGADRGSDPGSASTTVVGSWRQVFPRESCYSAPGVSWEARSDVRCTLHWPTARASPAFVASGGALWLHGGYTSFFPYPQVEGRGAAAGTGRIASDGLSPYPDHPFFLDDLWRYDLAEGLWEQITPLSPSAPLARRGHALVVAGDTFLLHGGYASNYALADFWLFNTSTRWWLEKQSFVHALFPDTCLGLDDGSGTVSAEESTVYGEPTRGTVLDGLDGRASSPVFIEQHRRQAPGWDGCRDRRDGRAALPAALQWEKPRQRSAAAAAFSDKHRLMLLYGGRALSLEYAADDSISRPARVAGDLWSYALDECPADCSDAGRCHFGFCFCDPGHYGVDCSNTSCPGDFCQYHPNTFEQVCTHCCHAGSNHSNELPADEDASIDWDATYYRRERKTACSAVFPGESHGICDGFGNCQCAPPYLSVDCSIRDCPNDCSGHGWCSLEFPNSRCMCEDGYTGADCSHRVCLNNCSYPNGICVNGECKCAFNANPFNRTIDWEPFQGPDCSFVAPFAGAHRALASSLVALLLALLLALAAVHERR